MSLELAEKVAKKRPKPEPKDEKATEPERKPMALQIRGSDEWKACLDRFAAWQGLPLASLVDTAIRTFAREVGFPEEFPKR